MFSFLSTIEAADPVADSAFAACDAAFAVLEVAFATSGAASETAAAFAAASFANSAAFITRVVGVAPASSWFFSMTAVESELQSVGNARGPARRERMA